jgi:hypothetical protein
MAFAKNIRTGKTTNVPEHYLGHPVLGKDLVAIDDMIEAAPKKEKNKKYESTSFFRKESVEEIEEQPAPTIKLENEENEDAY